MQTTKLQQEHIKDAFDDYVDLASEIIGCKCCDTVMQGDPEKGDAEETKYQILPDPYSARKLEDRINLEAFESYFYDHFGKWDERSYFDTPAEAFAQLIKAWHIWNNKLQSEKKQEYLERAKRIHAS